MKRIFMKTTFKVVSVLSMVLVIALSLPTTAMAAPRDQLPEGITILELDPADYYSADDVNLLEKLVQAEGGNQSLEVQTMIALVVLNRTKNDNFPDTIEGVINQKSGGTYQFSCVPDGHFAAAKPTEQVEEAVAEAMYEFVNDLRQVPDELLFFNSIDYFSWSTVEDYCHEGAMYFSTLK